MHFRPVKIGVPSDKLSWVSLYYWQAKASSNGNLLKVDAFHGYISPNWSDLLAILADILPHNLICWSDTHADIDLPRDVL